MRLLLAALLLFQADEADLLIRGALIHDGGGKDPIQGDLAIKGDTILAVGEWKGTAKKTIDAKGLVAAPGFIDLHNHSDTSILAEETRDNFNYTSQGCTTIVTGNCGGGALDAAALFKQIDQNGAGSNVIHLVPHGALRSKVFGSQRRPPTSDELEKMRALVEKGMRAGAWGISTGLIYVPGTYAQTDEIVELAKVAHAYGGIYASHIRNEAGGLLKSIAEAIEVGEKSGCPVQISHLKCSTKEAWGKMAEACALIEAARARGLKVTADQYPYIASSTRLSAYTIPSWALEGGKVAERLDDAGEGPKIRKEILENFEKRDGPDKLVIAGYAKNKAYHGKSVEAIARASGREPIDVVIEIVKGGDAQTVCFGMREDDMLVGMKKDWVATSSDGSAKRPSDERPHPRNYGTFSRKIGLFAAEKREIPLAFAIRSSSGLPADILGLKDRGYLRAGFKADLVLFDPATFRDRATFEVPDQYSTGAPWVYVNGVAVIAEGKKTDALPGRALR
ncbi:MAG: D-aminoacylase, partial [Planctomycetes bacterium]|nr:D-aminoacylase [Planctomycetota bacterium]